MNKLWNKSCTLQFLPILLLVFILGSCGPAVKYSPLDPISKSKPSECQLDVYMPDLKIPFETKAIGSIFIGDTGLTIDCGWDKTLERIKDKACASGADAVQLYEIKTPGWISTCYRIKANFLVYLDKSKEPVKPALQQQLSSSTVTPISPLPTPTPRSDALLSITVVPKIPAETERETLEIHVVVTSDNGIKDITITVRQPGTKGLSLGTIEEGQQETQKETQKTFTFSRDVPLKIGQNELVIEAVDLMGQVVQRVFSVTRKDTTELPVEISPELRQRTGNVYAVIIGIGDYQDDQLDLRFTVNDAQGLYDVLTNPHYGGVPKDQIKLLLDQEATDRNIKRAIGTWLRRQAKTEDTVIIYYSGHGAPEGEETYWVTYDADIDDLFSTALDNTSIANMLEKIESDRVITFLDSCYSAATVQKTDRTRDLQQSIPWDKFSGKGRVVISASDGKQLSLELEQYQHGVFTYYLLEGLKGQADENRDGVIEVDEIWDYVKYQVIETARKAGNPQTPVRQGSHTAGIPLTFNMLHLKQKILTELFQQGLITSEHFNCAFNMLSEDTSNPLLEGLLSGTIDLEIFNSTFSCDSQK